MRVVCRIEQVAQFVEIIDGRNSCQGLIGGILNLLIIVF